MCAVHPGWTNHATPLAVPPRRHRRGLSVCEHECVWSISRGPVMVSGKQWMWLSLPLPSPCLTPVLSRSNHPSLSFPHLWLWDSGNATPEQYSLWRIINECQAGGPMPPPDFSKQVLSVEPTALLHFVRLSWLTDWLTATDSCLHFFTSRLSLLSSSHLFLFSSLSPSHTHRYHTHTFIHTLVLYRVML